MASFLTDLIYKFSFDKSLRITETYKYNAFPKEKLAILAQLIDKLANATIYNLVTGFAEIISLGNQVNGLHPFNSFIFLLTDETCKKQIKIIFSEDRCTKLVYAKLRDEFRQGFCTYLQQRSDNDEILPNLDDFCETIKLEKDKLLPLIKEKNWKEFVDFVLLKP